MVIKLLYQEFIKSLVIKSFKWYFMNHILILPIGDFGLDHKDDVHHSGDEEAKDQEVKAALQVLHNKGFHCNKLHFKIIILNG